MTEARPYDASSLRAASERVVTLLAQFVGVNTVFVALNDGSHNVIVNAINREEVLAAEGTLPLQETYCGLVAARPGDVIYISDTAKEAATVSLPVTTQLGSVSYIGVPILDRAHRVCGTVCGMDRRPYSYSEQELDLLKAMAAFLGSVADVWFLAYHDPLTGVYNRNFLKDPGLAKDWTSLGCLFIDLDNFKHINDQHGHSTADSLLAELAERMSQVVRSSDLVFRMGGDEFMVLSPDVRSASDVEEIAARVQSAIHETPFAVHGRRLALSASIGLSFRRHFDGNLEALFQEADLAMYDVKFAGKDGFRWRGVTA
jgi:diguanylate cyclase (GGDEF)-like protein